MTVSLSQSTLSYEKKPMMLSLCIPTYNRIALLEEMLNSVLAQIEPSWQDQIELIISDNASADGTANLVTRLRAAYPLLHWNYFRQPENKGADANILNAVMMAKGEFVYLLSDDDILMPGALAKIFTLQHLYPKADAFCLNAKPFVEKITEKTGPRFRISKDREITGRDASLLFYGSWITFISAMVFRRIRIAGRNYEDRVGSSLLQSYLYLDVLTDASMIVVTCDPFLAVRGYNSGGFNFFEVFVTQFCSVLAYAKSQGFAPRTIRAVLNRHLIWYLTPYSVVFRVRDSYGTFHLDFRDAARRLIAAYRFHPFLLFVLLPLLFAPRHLLRGLHGGLKQTKSACRWLLSHHRYT